MMRPTSRKSSSSKPRIVIAGVPTRKPDATVGGRSSNGTVLRLTVIPTSGEAILRVLAAPLRAAQIDEQQVRVGTAGEDVQPALLDRRGERVRVRPHRALVLAEGLRRSDPEAGRLRRDHVVQRSALHPGEDGAVECLRVLLAAEDEPRPRPGERLVRRRGHEVAVLDRVRVQPRGHEAREVGHVAEQQCVHLVRDLAEAPGLDRARIRRAAAHDQLRTVLLREGEHVVVVDEVRLPRHAVVDDVVEPPGEIHLEAVGQVAAVGQLERENRVARLQDGEVDGHVRLRTRVRLHVRVLGAEERLRAVDRELLDLVDDLAAAVVATTGIPLGVLVRRDAADRLEHRRPREVLGRDQLDLPALALELLLEERRDLGIDVGQPCGTEILERQRGGRHPAGCYSATRARASAAGTAPSRSTRGSGPVRSITVDGVPGRSPPSRAAPTPSRISVDTSERRLGSAAPCTFALVAAITPIPANTSAAGPVVTGIRTPIVSGRAPVSHGSRRSGFGTTSVNGPATNPCSGQLGDQLDERIDAGRDERDRLTRRAPLEGGERAHGLLVVRSAREAVDGVRGDDHELASS